MRFACAALFLLAACGDVITCNDVTVDVGDACLPDALAPSISSVIELRELCGPGCSGVPTCTALWRNGQIYLDISQQICNDQASAACIDQGCQTRIMRCELPALNAGVYTLRIPGAPARVLKVETGGQSSCRFSEADGGVQ